MFIVYVGNGPGIGNKPAMFELNNDVGNGPGMMVALFLFRYMHRLTHTRDCRHRSPDTIR